MQFFALCGLYEKIQFIAASKYCYYPHPYEHITMLFCYYQNLH